MDYTVTADEKLKIEMPESVSEKNAAEVETELTKILTGNPGMQVVLNCKSLKYISSSGLRVILKAQKKLPKGEKIEMIEVSRDVNEILEMTGFIDIFNVRKRLSRMSIEGREKLYSVINGDFYKLDHDMILKVYRHGTSSEDVEQERNLAKKALTAGISTAISFSAVQVGEDRYGIVYEDFNGESLAQILKRDKNSLVMLAQKLATFVRDMHDTDVSGSGLPDIKDRYRTWIREMSERVGSFDAHSLESMVECMQDRTTFLHGDLNLNSVFLSDNELILMDMSSCGFGHPIFDLQGLYASLTAIEKDNPGYCEWKFGLPPERCQAFWNAFLNKYIALAEDGGQEISSAKLTHILNQYYLLKIKLIDEL